MGGRGSGGSAAAGISNAGQATLRRTGLREESLALVRSQRDANDSRASRPIEISVYPRRKPEITDGRHRLLVARERGDSHVEAKIREYDRSGRVVRTTTKSIGT